MLIRHYQAAQDCMCDTEHMFDCPNPSGSIVDDPMDSMDDMEFNRFLQQSIKVSLCSILLRFLSSCCHILPRKLVEQ
ncbi:hypothetical protein NQ314_015773 [Rhamnusium bicolor]|uniref:C-terminal peptide n=1 Tax=Rhamnusium bicolor TaxID=1586634 RepID=A0AAV8WYH5_9CUCU|nr:hypothetical protein NQ314_015773 [Rhamnusium bicolor]